MQSINLYVYCINNSVNFLDAIGEYVRADAVAYAKKWAKHWGRDPRVVRFRQDCTNFVSNALYYGGELKMYDDWYFHTAVQVGPYVKGSYSRTWSIANDQFNWLTNENGQFPNSNFMRGEVICIKESRWISDAISKYDIRPGDILYWDYTGDGTKDHAAMIVSVDNGRIKYAQHDADKNDGDLGSFLDNPRNSRAYTYVVRIRDDA